MYIESSNEAAFANQTETMKTTYITPKFYAVPVLVTPADSEQWLCSVIEEATSPEMAIAKATKNGNELAGQPVAFATWKEASACCDALDTARKWVRIANGEMYIRVRRTDSMNRAMSGSVVFAIDKHYAAVRVPALEWEYAEKHPRKFVASVIKYAK